MSNQRVQLPEVFSSKKLHLLCSFTVIPAGAFLVGLKTSKCIEQTYS